MIFLIDYDCAKGKLADIREYQDSEIEKAQKERLELEQSLLEQGIDREVVLLDADSRAVIEITHSRYFLTLKEMIESFQKFPNEILNGLSG